MYRWIVASMVLATSAVAFAQPDTTLAEQLFNQGRDLAKANNWVAACPKFEASLRYDATLGTKLNLATCYEKTGRLASAWGQFRDAADLAGKANDAKRRDYALKQAAALEPRIPKLTITAPAKAPPNLVIKRDGTTLDPAVLGSPLFVDPGKHEITASAPGFETFTKLIDLAESKAESLAVPELVARPEQPELTPKSDPKAQPGLVRDDPPDGEPVDRPAPKTRKYVAIGVAAGGAALLAGGFVFGSKASSTFADAKSLCGDNLECDSTDEFDRGRALIKDARSQATLSTILVAGGLAAVAGGVILYVTAPKSQRQVETARVVPVVNGRDVGVAVLGRF